MPSPKAPQLLLGHCEACGTWNFPAESWGCRACGAPTATLQAKPLPGPAILRNAVTVHAELAPGVPVPCVVGEIELAPGVIEEALLQVASEADVTLGSVVESVHLGEAGGASSWRFVPVRGGSA
jgi:uncharacterized OB-fold protein